MGARERLRADLGDAMRGPGGALAAADRLCRACVELLSVDGAAVSITHSGATYGTFGSSGELGRRLDELQFTFGEGPCLDAVSTGRPVLVEDVADRAGQRWPAFSRAALASGVRAVLAVPVDLARAPIGALDLFRGEAGPLPELTLDGGLWAAELAAVPLLELMTEVGTDEDLGDGWDQLASLERVEVYQATGMIIGHLDVDPSEALVRLRAYAFSHGLTAGEAAWAIVERRVLLTEDESFRIRPDADGKPA